MPAPTPRIVSNWTTWILVAALLGLLLNAVACKSKEKVDTAVDDLVAAMQADDFDKFKAIADASLLDKVKEPDFHLMARTVKRLGTFKERTMNSINIDNNVTNGQYTLDFDKGEVTLILTLVDSSLSGFEFQGDAVSAAMREVMAEDGAR